MMTWYVCMLCFLSLVGCRYIEFIDTLRSEIPARDGNFAHGSGYPRIPDPMGTGVGVIFYPWARPPETRRHHGQQPGFIFCLWVIHTRPDTYVLANFNLSLNFYTPFFWFICDTN